MAKQKMGRPRKYADIIRKLEADQLYTAACIAAFAVRRDLLSDVDAEHLHILRRRIRHTLNSFAKSRKFPPYGDGKVTRKGHVVMPAWYGWRWMASYATNDH